MALSLAISSMAGMITASASAHIKRCIDHMLSLKSTEEIETYIAIYQGSNGINMLLSYYLVIYDEIDWKAAGIMMKHCDYDSIKNEIGDIYTFIDNHERGIQRLNYLRDGDV